MELQGLFERLGADPRGGTCVEVGCGSGRMTAALAERFERVLALDVSPAMLSQRARRNVPDEHVEFRAVPGDRLDGIEDESRGRARVLSGPPAPAGARVVLATSRSSPAC